SLGLDLLDVVDNPLSGLASAGIGWLIEHISFLKEPLDDLAGDPDAISKVAVTWGDNIAKEVASIAEDLQQAIDSETASWEGDAKNAYKKSSDALVEQVRALEPAADSVSTAVQQSGVLVGTVRGLIRDLIADIVAEIIIAAATALATSWCTLGGSIAAFTGWAVARGAMTAGKIAGKVSKLLTKLANILSKFGKLRGAVRALGKAAKKFGDAAKKLGRTAGRNMSTARKVESTVKESMKAAGREAAGNVRETVADVGKDAAKGGAENAANADDDYRKEQRKQESEPTGG
ncbi:MAG: WXG100 family type VII secretion target, partial [Thermocrispum sp.]